MKFQMHSVAKWVLKIKEKKKSFVLEDTRLWSCYSMYLNVKRDGLHKHMHLSLIKKDKTKHYSCQLFLKFRKEHNQKAECERLLWKLCILVVQLSDIAVQHFSRSLVFSLSLFKFLEQFKRQIASCARINAFHLNLLSRGVRPKDVILRERKR